MKVFFDMDGVTAKWKPGTFDEITAKGYFLHIPAQKNVCDAAKILLTIPDIDFSFLSAVMTEHSKEEKAIWLNKQGLGHAPRTFVPCGENKADYIHAENGDICILLDDYTPNLLGWEGTEAENNVQYKAVKFLNGINNTTKRWNGRTISVDCDAETIVEEILKLR